MTTLPPLPEGFVVNAKLGVFCGFDSTTAKKGDVVYPTEQMQAYALAHNAALLLEVERLTGAIATAYGYLWHVNNEPMTPNQYAPERAAYEARKVLRDLLTHERRGVAINTVRASIVDAARASLKGLT